MSETASDNTFVIEIWKRDGEYCVTTPAEDKVFVYPTKRSMMRKAEKLFDEHYK